MNISFFSKRCFSAAVGKLLTNPFANNNLKITTRNLVNKKFEFPDKKMASAFLEDKKYVCNFHKTEIQFQKATGDVGLIKKRSLKRRYAPEIDLENLEDGRFSVMAFATAKEYDLEQLRIALKVQDLYDAQKMSYHVSDMSNVLVTLAKYQVGHEPRHILFFREGAVVFWNCGDLEISNVLQFLEPYQDEAYASRTVFQEREVMTYGYQVDGKKCQLNQSSFMLSPEPENMLERYTFSNAMALSVKLGVWEASLDQFADSIANITEDLERGKPIRMTRAEVLRQSGTLFALRHHINLESDLLDTPDFYWEQPELEKLYSDTSNYFSLTRRTKVLNEKLSHCAELVDLVAAQLSDRHHVRLEWMIIILIMVEVGFETLHFLERYWQHLAE